MSKALWAYHRNVLLKKLTHNYKYFESQEEFKIAREILRRTGLNFPPLILDASTVAVSIGLNIVTSLRYKIGQILFQ